MAKYEIGDKVTVRPNYHSLFPEIFNGKTGKVINVIPNNEKSFYNVEFAFYTELLELIKHTCIFSEDQIFKA